MHETKLMQGMLEVIRRVQQDHAGRLIRCFHFELSEFGGWDQEHFREHFKQAVSGTPWQEADLEIHKVFCGPEARLVSVSFEGAREDRG
ncbi:MAG: hydrogenase/urease maturation nickel metallochaperone HypA [Candidatus Omnitrophota bacterium]